MGFKRENHKAGIVGQELLTFQRVSGGLEAGSYAQVRCPLIDLTRRFVTKLVCTLQVKLWEAALGTKRVLAVRVRVRNL